MGSDESLPSEHPLAALATMLAEPTCCCRSWAAALARTQQQADH